MVALNFCGVGEKGARENLLCAGRGCAEAMGCAKCYFSGCYCCLGLWIILAWKKNASKGRGTNHSLANREGKRTIKEKINLILSGCLQRAHPSFKLPKERLIKVILSSKNDEGGEMGLV